MSEDKINHPKHYTSHPSGVECLTITEHMGFCLGNALKYIWRAELKDNKVDDLKKAIFYINRELEKCEEKKSQPYEQDVAAKNAREDRAIVQCTSCKQCFNKYAGHLCTS